MSGLLITTVVVLVFVVIFQIAKASEYVSVLKGEQKARQQSNRINGFLMIGFLLLGLVGVWWCNELLYKKTLLVQDSASVEGELIDKMLWWTLAITGIVFFITQILLFWFAFRYQESPNRKAHYYPHNNKLELIWTAVPAIALTILVGFGLKYWFRITSDAPADAQVVEITGKQFGWIYRYAGKDQQFGKKYYKNIQEAEGNDLGLLWDEDPAAQDDVVLTQALYVVKGKPVKLVINARDVVHDVGLAHFRMKMDAVPGTPTTMWFTPKYTTKEMKEKTGNPDFLYEISCDQMCGKGHYSMKGIIEVVTQEEFDIWMAQQKPTYLVANPDKDPANAGAGAAAAQDSTKAIGATPVAKTTEVKAGKEQKAAVGALVKN